MPNRDDDPARRRRRSILGLCLLFGAMYFVQGISEPVEGLVGQPVKSFLKSQQYGPGAIATFAAVLALPWAIKPVYGVLTDFVPLFGYRRRSYLLVATAAATLGLLALFAAFTPALSGRSLLLALFIPSVAIAFTDVVIDAVMVERGQQYGMTGRFQSIQWAALYAAPIFGGPIAGYLAQHRLHRVGFLICGAAAALSLVLTYLFVHEQPQKLQPGAARNAFATLRQAAATPGLPAVAGFLFLWNFNPFLNEVLYVHLTQGLRFDETFYGWTISLTGVASVVASIAYGFYCRRVPFGVLLHASIALGVLSTLGYAAVVGRTSVIAVTLVVGFTYMTAVLIQLDLVARACPPAVAATAFALLMSVTNISLATAIAFGGHTYAWATEQWGPHAAFRLVVMLGAVCSVSCWAFVPFLRRHVQNLETAETNM